MVRSPSQERFSKPDERNFRTIAIKPELREKSNWTMVSVTGERVASCVILEPIEGDFGVLADLDEIADYRIDSKFMRFLAPFQLGTTLHRARGNIRISG